jgi:LuxR family maltose regulon positive regulatory protein
LVRNELRDKLEEGSRLPLTLVCAPAGYGKTTLVSQWLESRDGRPSAWLSLDESDSDLRTFLSYVVAAVRMVSPEACNDTLAQLDPDRTPQSAVLAGILGNDLCALEEPLILVLDDYQHIHAQAVHDIVDRLLKRPAPCFHMAILSRGDPALSLGSLRAHGMMIELRSHNLAFTESETTAFFEQTGHAVDGSVYRSLHDALEGWPVGVRLAAEVIRRHGDAGSLLSGFHNEARRLREYLVESIMAHQSPAMRDCLRRASILNRFCAPLCEAIFAAEGPSGQGSVSGHGFLRDLQDTGLPVAALDDAGRWYRYHQLVQDLLRFELESRLAPDEIADLHRRAQEWHEVDGLLDEATLHAEKADGAASAGRLIVRHGNRILNEGQFHRLERLPEDVVQEDSELLLLRAWQLRSRGSYAPAYATLDRIEDLMGSGPKESRHRARTQGGVHALRSSQRYNEGRGELAKKHAEQALMLLPPDCLRERGYALIYRGRALQMCGDLNGARKLIHDEMAGLSGPGASRAYGRFCLTLCFLNWIAADWRELKLTSTRCVELGEEEGLAELALMGRWFEGMVSYQQNDLSDARDHLMQAVTAQRISNLEYLAESGFCLAYVYQALGQENDARDSADAASAHIFSARNPPLLRRAQACQANLALRQGRLAEALRWAHSFDPEPLEAMIKFQEPPIVLAKVLLAEGSEESREQAGLLLTRLQEFLDRTHSRSSLIEILALQGLLHGARGEESAAADLLARAVSLGQPGGFIRVFVDLGPELARLLNRVDADEAGLEYIGRILAAFRAEQRPKAAGAEVQPAPSKVIADRHPSGSPLTEREMEILGLLAKRLSNKEIGRELYISPGTVKRHASTIFSKLGVHDRRKAVAKAVGLGILQ